LLIPYAFRPGKPETVFSFYGLLHQLVFDLIIARLQDSVKLYGNMAGHRKQQETSFALADKRDFFDGKKRVKGTKRQKDRLKVHRRGPQQTGTFPACILCITS
jgi:hypothetical protein